MLEYSFTPSKEYIRETHDMPAKAKLPWLEEANRFVLRGGAEVKAQGLTGDLTKEIWIYPDLFP